MLTCITCSKQKTEEEEEDDREGVRRASPGTKDPIKSLTTQIKDIAIKASGGHKGKDGPTEGRGKKSYRGFGATSQPRSSLSSTPAWDFASSSSNLARGRHSRFTTFDKDTNPSCETVIEDEDEDESKEWMAQVEPGIQITFVSLHGGGNDLKRIRFSREMFDKWEAQLWWGENYDRIMELYNVQRFNQQAPYTPSRSDDGRDSTYSRLESSRESPRMSNKECRTPRYKSKGYYTQESFAYANSSQKGEMAQAETSRMTASSASVSLSNASDIETEWIEEDEPGVYITIRQLIDGTRELRRVRFSREKFGEVHAKLWWEANRDRIQEQYLS